MLGEVRFTGCRQRQLFLDSTLPLRAPWKRTGRIRDGQNSKKRAFLLDETPKTVRKYANEEETLKKGMEEKSSASTEKGNELYAKA